MTREELAAIEARANENSKYCLQEELLDLSEDVFALVDEVRRLQEELEHARAEWLGRPIPEDVP